MISHSQNFQYEICDIYYDDSSNILLFGGGYNNNFLSNVGSFNFNSVMKMFDNKGQLSMYNITNANYGEKKMNILYKEVFMQGISKIKFYKEKNWICVGFFDGSFNVFEYKNNTLIKIFQLHPHSYRIINFHLDKINEYLYSIAERENDLSISKLNYQMVFRKKILTQSPITAFEYITQVNRVVVADSNGSLWLYQIQNYTDVNILQGIHTKVNNINTIHVNKDNTELIFVGSNCQIDLYEILDSDIIQINHKITFKSGFDCTSLYFNSRTFTLYAAMSNGTLQVWSHSKEVPEYVQECYNGERVNCIWFDSNSNIIITGSNGKIAKIWQVPEKFNSELCRSNQLYNEEFVISTTIQGFNSINAIKKAFALMTTKEESDKDDLRDYSNDKIIDDKEGKEDDDLLIEDDGERSLDGWDEIAPYSLNHTNNKESLNESLMDNIKEKYTLFKSYLWN